MVPSAPYSKAGYMKKHRRVLITDGFALKVALELCRARPAWLPDACGARGKSDVSQVLRVRLREDATCAPTSGVLGRMSSLGKASESVVYEVTFCS